MKYLLNATDVCKTYPVGLKRTSTVLHNCNLRVQVGEAVSLIGINGAGKTTLLKMLVGVAHPTSGSITINGLNASDPYARRSLGYMPENPQFYNDISAVTLLTHVAGLFGLSRTQSQSETDRLLTLVDLTAASRAPIRTYSKGMRQRLGFAQALIGSPKLVLLDEPLDGLDPLGRQTLKQHIQRLKNNGVTIILCSHILSDIAEISDRVGVLHQGYLRELVSPKTFIGSHNSLETAFVASIS